MVKNNNVDHDTKPSPNGDVSHHDQLPSESSGGSTVATGQTYAQWLLGWWDAIVDFAWFIICSIGFILQNCLPTTGENLYKKWKYYFICFPILIVMNGILYHINCVDLYYICFGYPEKDLNTDIALITGGGNGLGRLLALRLGKMGTKVVIWDINTEGIKETITMVEENGGYCKGYVVDISKKEDVYKAADVIRTEIGDVTLLINNAGVVSGLHLLDTPDHLIERSFNVNVLAHFWTTKAFLPQMIANERGHIATIASLAGHVGITKLVDYCASKFAAVGFDEALRLELDVLGHSNIQTTCICPFFIQATGMFDDVNARWVPTLNPNDVADRVVQAIKKNEKIAIIPGYIRFLLSLKWTFPWGCVGGLLRRLVPDAAPHGIAEKAAAPPNKPITTTTVTKTPPSMPMITDISSLAKRTDNFGDSLPKTPSLLIQRTPSQGERVL